ncbi:MAG TPA: acyl-CoA dehydrogenase family protein, partial [Myxococcota bacterium]|nr:acyl-CoA dehydrogenase family protein [Myxococcota bacterium]
MVINTKGTEQNLFRRDALLFGLTKRFLPHDSYLLFAPKLENFAEEICARVMEWGTMAEHDPPRLTNYDAFGNRIDKLHLSPAWLKLKQFAAVNRLVALGYDKKLRQGRRVAQAVMQIMFSAHSSTHSCPLAMTDGVIKVLLEYAPQSIREQVIPELLGKDLSEATCGQWMTEKSGGSDLRSIETQATFARKEEDREIYRLYGLKWFASSIDSEYALVLAQIPEAGPSLMLVKVWQEKKLSDGIRIDRLKNKLGTKALATAEVRLEGALGTLIGIKGKGIYCASPLLNITRFYNALASASIMNRAYFTALDYALVRYSFKKPLIEHPLHRQSLA